MKFDEATIPEDNFKGCLGKWGSPKESAQLPNGSALKGKSSTLLETDAHRATRLNTFLACRQFTDEVSGPAVSRRPTDRQRPQPFFVSLSGGV